MLPLAGDDQNMPQALGVAGFNEILDDHDRFFTGLAMKVDLFIRTTQLGKGRITFFFRFFAWRYFRKWLFVRNLVDVIENFLHVPVFMTGFQKIDLEFGWGRFLPAHGRI